MLYKEIFLILFVAASCVTSELGLSEGASCTADGKNGTCYNIYKCTSAAMSYIYKKGGFNEEVYPKIPEICSHDGDEPVVCCTDCPILVNMKERLRNSALSPKGVLRSKDGPLAWKKCLEYFNRLPYKCRGHGNVNIKRKWSENEKCHHLTYGMASPVGGHRAERWEFPHMALLGFGDDKNSADWLCGGSVISERFILTAAHCTSTHTLGPIKYAALGILKRTDPKDLWKIYDIKRIILHPEYHSPMKYHDIALLETEIEIKFDKTLLPACLDAGKLSEHQNNAEAAGWGRLGHREGLADNLEVVHLSQFEEQECDAIYGPHRHLKTGYNHTIQMCYGSRREIIDTCEGDSGGPLQVDDHKCLYFVIGLTSYGKDCGILGSAGMYTRVKYYVPWIESIVWSGESA